MHHSTSWWVSALRSSHMVGSPAVSLVSPLASESSSERVLARTAIGSSGSGMSQGATSSGSSLAETVSPVSALASLVTATMSPATAKSTGRSVAPSGVNRCPTRSSASWSSCPRSASPCPTTCTDRSGLSVPENTRSSDTRPTYGSTVVLTTSATSGPAGSQRSGSCGLPSMPVTGGTACSTGVGNALVSTSSRASAPSPEEPQAASTG